MHSQQPSAIGGFRGSRRGRNVQPELHVQWYFWTNCVSNHKCNVYRHERHHGRSLGKPNDLHLHHTDEVKTGVYYTPPPPFFGQPSCKDRLPTEQTQLKDCRFSESIGHLKQCFLIQPISGFDKEAASLLFPLASSCNVVGFHILVCPKQDAHPLNGGIFTVAVSSHARTPSGHHKSVVEPGVDTTTGYKKKE